MNWRGEFDADYAVPRWFVDHPDLEDTSWHNDVSPSFETESPPGTESEKYAGGPRVRVWVEHPDPAVREAQRAERYSVQLTGEDDDAAGEYRYCDDVWILDTDDLQVVDRALRWAQGLIAQYGLSMCAADDSLGMFPQQERLFDATGKPNFPSLPPLPPPCDVARPRGEVERALEEINAQRRELALPPLDPEGAGWTEQDVLEEAARIRLKNCLTAM